LEHPARWIPEGNTADLNADLLLLLTAAIWGFAFVAQRLGNDYMGPFTFNAIRFTLGAVALLPLLFWRRKHESKRPEMPFRKALLPALLTGLALFAGATLQQVGLLGTTAGKAGFITGLYVILVPLVALTWGKRTHWGHWIGAILAVAGLYFLSIGKGFTISSYDLIVLVGAFVWAGHVHLIDRYTGKIGPIRLSILQFAVCGFLSTVVALLTEEFDAAGIAAGIWPILYGGLLSVGLAYTLQVIAQRTADPSHAVIILSLEGAFAALGGWLVLGEALPLRGLLGCALMLAGTLMSQFIGSKRKDMPDPA
jgi:drug/metabolite transporter (DMT)-like permease